MQIHNSYYGLNAHIRTPIDASMGGALMKKTINEAYELLEDMATNSYQWPKERLASKKVARVVDIDLFSNLETQVSYSTDNYRLNRRRSMSFRLIL